VTDHVVTEPAAGFPERRGGVRRWAALAPLWSSDIYATLLAAQLIAILARWMQLLGGQWFFIDEKPSMVALVSTALALPTVLFAPIAGAFADMIDRRRMLIVTQGCLFGTASLIAALSVAGLVSSWMMLFLMFLMGTGLAVNMPPWQSLQSEVVPKEHLVQAATLTAVGANIGRAVGPAIGGVVVGLSGVGGVFATAAVTYGLAFTFTARMGTAPTHDRQRERLGEALKAGNRYVRFSGTTRRILLWTCIFIPINSGLWALLPALANGRLGLNAAGYGLLLGAVGAGALIGALVMPSVKKRLTSASLFTLSMLTVGLATVGVTAVRNPWVVGLLLLPVGAAYIAMIALFNATLQLLLPRWVRARGLAIYTVVFHGAMSIGSAVWGFVANGVGTGWAVAISGLSLLVFVPLSWWLRFPATSAVPDDQPVTGWTEPELVLDVYSREGPVTVTVVYRVSEENRREFVRTMAALGDARRRSGATRHEVLQEGSEPDTFIEMYVVSSWSDHVRQQAERLTEADRALERRANELAERSGAGRHWFGCQDEKEGPNG
jgi:MFS family permease